MPGVTMFVTSDTELYIEVNASTNAIDVRVSAVVMKLKTGNYC